MSWRRYAAERIAAYLFVLFLSLVAVFLMFRVIAPRLPDLPGAPPELRGVYEDYYDGNLVERFGDFLAGLVRGPSFYLLDPRERLADASAVTLSVVAGALLLAVAAGVPLGVLAARRRRAGGVVRAFVYLAVGLIPIWLGLQLSFYLAFRWEIVPLTGYCDFFNPETRCGGAVEWLRHLLLPWFTLGLGLAAIYAHTVRALVRRADRYVAEAPVDERASVRREMRQQNAIALTKRVARDVGVLIGASVMVELVFALRGLGRSLFDFPDYPYREAVLVVAVLIAFTVDLVVNLIGAALTPRWRTR